MTTAFFQKQMEVLMSDFGREEYTPNRLRMIYDTCKDLPDRNFAAICTHFIQTRSIKYPPLPTHFIEEAHRQRKLLNDRLAVPETIPHEQSRSALQSVLARLGVKSLSEAINQKSEDVGN